MIDAEQSLIRLLEFPKGQVVVEEKKNDFNFWRGLAIDYKKQNSGKKTNKPYIFGKKRQNLVAIPHQKGLILLCLMFLCFLSATGWCTDGLQGPTRLGFSNSSVRLSL